MKRLPLLMLLAFLMISNFIMAQDIGLTYKVTHYSLDGVNYDDVALKQDIALSFYKCSGHPLCFANHWRNAGSQSYGGVYALQIREIEETSTTYPAVELKFTWQFFNTYDKVTGRAAVTITNNYIGNTTKFTAEIVVLETNKVLKLKGYLE